MNAQWLGDILLGDFEALREMQCRRYSVFGLPDPFAPAQHLVLNLLGERVSRPGAHPCVTTGPAQLSDWGPVAPAPFSPPVLCLPSAQGFSLAGASFAFSDRPLDGRRTRACWDCRSELLFA